MHQAFYQQGLAKSRAKDYNGAIIAFTHALEQQFDFADAYYQRGLAHFKRCDFTAAIADYTKTLQFGGDAAGKYFARGLAYLLAQHLDAAIADAKQAILLNPSLSVAYNLIGRARQRQGKHRKAIASYKKAAELYLEQRDIVGCRRCLEHIYKLQSIIQTSLQFAEESASLGSLQTPLIDPNQFFIQAIQKAQKTEYRVAMEDLDWAIQIDPQDAQAYSSRGQVRADLGDLQNAIEDYQKAATLFILQANYEMAQQMQDTINKLHVDLKQTAKMTRSYWETVDLMNKQISDDIEDIFEISEEDNVINQGRIKLLKWALLRLAGNNRMIAARLVKRIKLKNPGMPDEWYIERAIHEFSHNG